MKRIVFVFLMIFLTEARADLVLSGKAKQTSLDHVARAMRDMGASLDTIIIVIDYDVGQFCDFESYKGVPHTLADKEYCRYSYRRQLVIESLRRTEKLVPIQKSEK